MAESAVNKELDGSRGLTCLEGLRKITEIDIRVWVKIRTHGLRNTNHIHYACPFH